MCAHSISLLTHFTFTFTMPVCFDVFLTVHHSIDFSKYQLNAQFFYSSTYICYTALLNKFRAACCSKLVEERSVTYIWLKNKRIVH